MALPTTTGIPTIFREYIGPKSYPEDFRYFPDIINSNLDEFHFIIAFASEAYDEGKGTGKFSKNWTIPDIDGEMIRKLKNEYEQKSVNVKVVISIGGRGSNYPFNPVDKETWPDKARDSLIEIINDLKDHLGTNMIDGIDINYDTINPGAENVFASCIWSLINSLKYDNHLVNLVSISPSKSVQSHYQTLHSAHKNDIDWVNYQFYTHAIATADEFKGFYRRLANDVYTRHNLLVGFSTDPKDKANLSQEVFMAACKDLINNGHLHGIFFWNANDSSAANETHLLPPFHLERAAQRLLTQRPRTQN